MATATLKFEKHSPERVPGIAGLWLPPLLLVFAFAPCIQPTQARADDVQVKAEQIGQLFPFQAARIKLTVQNNGSNTLIHPAEAIVVESITAPGESPYNFRASVVQLHETSAGHRDSNATKGLMPGEKKSVTFALAAEWSRKARFLFPRPGNYALKVGYSGMSGSNVFSEPLIIHVNEPQGADASVIGGLKSNDKLLEVMLSPFSVPDAEQAKQLREIVNQHSNSTYAPYARFALARAAIGGTRLAGNAPSKARDEALGQLRPIASTDFAYAPQTLLMLNGLSTGQQERTVVQNTLRGQYSDAAEMHDLDKDQLAKGATGSGRE